MIAEAKMIAGAIAVFGFISAISASQPISPADYQNIIGQGFSTNWFKTEKPLSKYNDKNIDDIFSKGFRNVRLRSRADLYSFPYNHTNFTWFLGNLTVVVDKCIEVGVVPIVSWIHHKAEAYATKHDRKAYLTWWTIVARYFKDRHHRLSFNLFTELGIDGSVGDKSVGCSESLRMRSDKYNDWTAAVVKAIRDTGGNNADRILILGSPGKTGKDLDKINADIYQNDPYIMAEWHIYASGPNKKKDGQKYWSGNGRREGRNNVEKAIKAATDFTTSSNLLTYLGAWMPTDNEGGRLKEREVINFARFFASELRKNNIPWSLNVLDRYYDTETSEWRTGNQIIKGATINMAKVLKNIQNVM